MQPADQAPSSTRAAITHQGTHTCMWKPLPALGREEQFSCRSGEERETPQSNLRHGESEICLMEPIKNTRGISSGMWNLRETAVTCYRNREHHDLRARLWGQKDKKEECRLGYRTRIYPQTLHMPVSIWDQSTVYYCRKNFPCTLDTSDEEMCA